MKNILFSIIVALAILAVSPFVQAQASCTDNPTEFSCTCPEGEQKFLSETMVCGGYLCFACGPEIQAASTLPMATARDAIAYAEYLTGVDCDSPNFINYKVSELDKSLAGYRNVFAECLYMKDRDTAGTLWYLRMRPEDGFLWFLTCDYTKYSQCPAIFEYQYEGYYDAPEHADGYFCDASEYNAWTKTFVGLNAESYYNKAQWACENTIPDTSETTFKAGAGKNYCLIVLPDGGQTILWEYSTSDMQFSEFFDYNICFKSSPPVPKPPNPNPIIHWSWVVDAWNNFVSNLQSALCTGLGVWC